MQFRSLIPALMVALAGAAFAQATAPAPEPATPAQAAAPAAPATAATSEAAAEPAADTKTAAAPQQRCHKEYRVGSNLPKTVCETEKDSDTEHMREQALDDLKHAVRGGTRTVGH